MPFSKLALRTAEPPINWLMSTALSDPGIISLAAGFTDRSTLPVSEVRCLCQNLLSARVTGQVALQYGTTAGDPGLRQLAAGRLARADGSGEDLTGRLFITSGSQQLLYLLSEALCDPGDIVLVEDPTYFVYLGIVQSHGLRCAGIRMEPDGVDVGHLEEVLERLKARRLLPRLKFAYLVTYFQNPTGTTTSLEKKRAVLRLFRRYEREAGHRLYLVEDAAYRELRFDGPDVPSALTLPGSADRVIYAGTFSKPFATGMRVGLGVLPAGILRQVLRIKGNHDFGTSNLLQQLLRRALESDVYASHVERLRLRYGHKASVMLRALRRYFPAEARWREPKGGLYVWAETPHRMPTGMHSGLFRAAIAHQVLYVPGELCYAEDRSRPRPNHEMRLSFGGAEERDIVEGVARLGSSIRDRMRRSARRSAS